MRRLLSSLLALALAAPFAACMPGSEEAPRGDLENDPPLANVDELFAGVPKSDDIQREYGKFDGLLPVRSDELLATMSPVRNQQHRGVCSIFSTVGLMEHLYIAEGTITDPDFSEQYLQWSAKFEVGAFPNTSGSNASFNLQAIHNFGIVAEDVWPYEGFQWGTSDDAACTGEDDQPTRCYTNGEPTDEMKASRKFSLPRGRFLSTRDIKAHIHTTKTAVIVGLTFFYQAWNHRHSKLPVNSENWNNGIVLYPNDKDRELSLEDRAGHSIVILGWDDEMEVPIRDENGDLVLDDNGNPKVERGFYLFKNSWGTTGFGIDHPAGPGYGWISQRYVREFGRAQVSGLPTDVEPLPGDGDGREVSFDGEGFDIPDNDPAGNSSTITVADTGAINKLSVDVDITHTFRGDLKVSLVHDGQTVVLQDQSGGGQDDLVATFAVDGFEGGDIEGDWTLVVSDNARIDTGKLNTWTLHAFLAE